MNKKYVKGLLSLSLSGMMALSLAAPVFAEAPTNAKAYITKEFDMPVGTNLPDGGKTFEFTISGLTKDGTALKSGPTFTNTISIAEPTSTNNISKKTVELNNAGNEYKITRYVGYSDLFKDSKNGNDTSATTLGNFLKKDTAAGVGSYTFTITENKPQSADGDVQAETDESGRLVADNVEKDWSTANSIKTTKTFTNSKAQYKASLDVTSDGTISNLKVTKENREDGTGITSDNEKKVDPSKPDDNIPGSGGLRFINTYTEKITKNGTGGDIPDPDPSNPTQNDPRDLVFSVGKIVSGNMAGTDQAFDFQIGVTRPSLVTGTTDNTFTAKIYKKVKDNELSIVDPKGRAEDQYINSTDKTITFTSGNPITVKLKHGEKLAFDSLYVGTAFEAQETDKDTTYRSSTYVRLNGGTPAEREKERARVTGNVTEGTDTVVVVNTKNSASPTGIFVDNLPFILLVLGVIAGFAGYIASKRRREVR